MVSMETPKSGFYGDTKQWGDPHAAGDWVAWIPETPFGINTHKNNAMSFSIREGVCVSVCVCVCVGRCACNILS